MECSLEPENTDSSVPFTVETAKRISKKHIDLLKLINKIILTLFLANL
jgi:hypothetical protein